MIVSFGDKNTESIWNGIPVRTLPILIQQIGRRKLRMLNNAENLIDLKTPPSNRLEKLAGSFKNFFSIRINDRWRMIFKWNEGHAEKVSIIDYH